MFCFPLFETTLAVLSLTLHANNCSHQNQTQRMECAKQCLFTVTLCSAREDCYFFYFCSLLQLYFEVFRFFHTLNYHWTTWAELQWGSGSTFPAPKNRRLCNPGTVHQNPPHRVRWYTFHQRIGSNFWRFCSTRLFVCTWPGSRPGGYGYTHPNLKTKHRHSVHTRLNQGIPCCHPSRADHCC